MQLFTSKRILTYYSPGNSENSENSENNIMLSHPVSFKYYVTI